MSWPAPAGLRIFMLAAALACAPAGAARGQDGDRAADGRVGAPEAPAKKVLDDMRIRVGRLRYGGGGDWYSNPSSLPNLLKEFEARTGIPTAVAEKIVSLEDQDLFATPFLYMNGHGNVQLTPVELSRLREHLLGGGFLFADDNYGMDQSFRRMVRLLFPERELAVIPLDHGIYRCFYELDGPPKIHEHDGKAPEGLGVFNGDRLMIFYTYESDIGDGLEDADVHNDPPGKREQAVRMAVNVLYYALTE